MWLFYVCLRKVFYIYKKSGINEIRENFLRLIFVSDITKSLFYNQYGT
jgi:hypothetical protein